MESSRGRLTTKYMQGDTFVHKTEGCKFQVERVVHVQVPIYVCVDVASGDRKNILQVSVPKYNVEYGDVHMTFARELMNLSTPATM